ncbi:MAG TPA: DUF2339 domain-containing protein [Alphaproteobacteria bacterium]|nr:DUF2339 domain-containing protein [Alphaproteobacteria bacterium]
MAILFGLTFFGLIIASLILPWVQRGRIRELTQKIDTLTNQVSWLISYIREKGGDVPEQWEKQTTPAAPFVPQPKPIKSVPLKKPETTKVSKKTAPQISWEQRIASSLPIWIGGIALVLAGVFMVKYSIETGLFSPSVRLVLAGIFGIFLLFAGNWIHNKPDIANGVRISQALSGAGIADLYVCLFAATSLYHLVPSLIGFIGMAVVTAIAVVLSLRQGAPIALLGLIGGFLTPALIGSQEPNAPFLFMYLYFVLAGLFTVIRKKNWWLLSIPAVLGAFVWVLLWLGTNYSPHDGLWLGLFLIAVSITIVLTSKKAMEEGTIDFKLSTTLNVLSMAGAVLLMSAVAVKSNFGEIEWGLFGFLAAGGIVLSYYNQKLYGFIPWISMIINAVMLSTWTGTDPATFTLILTGFALLFTVSSYGLMWKSPHPVLMATLSGVSSIAYYLLTYGKFHNWLEGGLDSPEIWQISPHLWSSLAFGLFVLSVSIVTQVLNAGKWDDEKRQKVLSIFTLTAVAFFSIALTIELQKEFLTIALALEVLAVSWINRHVHIKILRFVAGLLAVLFGILLIPHILLQLILLSNALTSEKILALSSFNWPVFLPAYPKGLLGFLQENIPTVSWSLLHLGLPALTFASSSILLRLQKDNRLVSAFEVTSISLFAVLAYYLTRHAFHIGEDLLFANTQIIERSVITNIFFLLGLACFWVGRKFKRNAISLSGLALSGLALFRITYFDLLVDNPLWSHQFIGPFPIFNTLLLVYGLPMVWLMLANKELPKMGRESYLRYTDSFLCILALAFVSFSVRQFYQGEYLDGKITSNAEIYTYSVAWLLMGIGLLFFGVLWQDKTLRAASLAFMILAVGKVFLYDAAELTGLFRVFSFLGLGMSLLGLSWFYTRFVFKGSR